MCNAVFLDAKKAVLLRCFRVIRLHFSLHTRYTILHKLKGSFQDEYNRWQTVKTSWSCLSPLGRHGYSRVAVEALTTTPAWSSSTQSPHHSNSPRRRRRWYWLRCHRHKTHLAGQRELGDQSGCQHSLFCLMWLTFEMQIQTRIPRRQEREKELFFLSFSCLFKKVIKCCFFSLQSYIHFKVSSKNNRYAKRL